MSEDKTERRPRSREGSPAMGARSPRHAECAYSASPSRASATARLAEVVPGSPTRSDRRNPRTRHGDADSTLTPLAGATGSSPPGAGHSSLSQALRAGFTPNTPRSGKRTPKSGATTPRENQEDTARIGRPIITPSSYNSRLGRSPGGSSDIEVLKRHLVGPSTAESGSLQRQSQWSGRREQHSSAADGPEFSSLQLQGGDVTRHIYRYAEKREREQAEVQDRDTGRLKRSMSVTLPKTDTEEVDIQSIQVPGGFRRDHLRRAAASPAPSGSNRHFDYGTTRRTFAEPAGPEPQFVTNNFIEFLTLYGHFAGEEFDDDDEELTADEYFSSDTATNHAEEGRSDGNWGEDSALLAPGQKKRRRKQREAGTGTPMGAGLLLLKSFVGTGVLFLPRAYYNGGMLFANVVLCAIAAVSYYCFILLVSVRLKIPTSFGDMGERLFGPYFRNMINFSLVISQMGFTSAYTVFVAENMQAFILAVTDCKTFISVKWFIFIQMVILLPVSLYRNINKIQKMALVADLFICLGLVYLYYTDIVTMVRRPGIADIKLFNADTWTLFIGTAIFTFEGIGLVIPIQGSMREPEKFPKVLASVMVIISVIFISAGAVSYAAYGSNTKTVILLNMPQDDDLVNAVQLLYSLAILMSTPLQIYPAIEITSRQIFSSSTGKNNPLIKWQKNLFRFFMVILACAIAWLGASDLDKFVSLVGSFACIPLVYIYPPMMHYRVVATRAWQKITDVILVIFGFCMMAYATSLTIASWVNGGDIKSPGYCDS